MQASDGPYAWEHRSVGKEAVKMLSRELPTPSSKSSSCTKTRMNPRDLVQQLQHLKYLPRTEEVFTKIQEDPYLSCKLPGPNDTAGAILQHAMTTFEHLRSRESPLIFKFVITHDASFRWHNPKYGYKRGIDRFQRMLVIYAAPDPIGPAFLEAALISHFSGSVADINRT